MSDTLTYARYMAVLRKYHEAREAAMEATKERFPIGSRWRLGQKQTPVTVTAYTDDPVWVAVSGAIPGLGAVKTGWLIPE